MGSGNAKEKPKDKEKRDQARIVRAIEHAIESSSTRLDLNNRHIRELPESFEGKKDALKWFGLSHNELKTLPSVVCEFVSLTALRLNGNQLTSLPAAISALSNLQVLDISKNKFALWDDNIMVLPQLTDLNLQCNQIRSLPENIGSLSTLKYLNLYINSITNFDVEWSGLTALVYLDLSFNGLTDDSLTDDFVLPALTFLPLCGNKLTTIPPPVLRLASLKSLDMRFNCVETIPDDLGAMASGLRTLKLCNNKLRSLPPSLSQLVSLEELDLSSNLLEDLENVQGLLKLTSLHVYWNKVKSLPEDFGNLEQLKELYLTDNKLKALPESMSRLVNLRTFMVHYNGLSTVPSISGLSSASVLNLSENDLVNLPEDIDGLTSLTRLDVRANILATLPPALANMNALLSLEIGDNNFLSIPSVIFDIKSLTTLNLFSNGITVIPEGIANLSSLSGLNLSFNQLVSLPAEFAQLKSLAHLRLEGNFFKEFPDPIVHLTNLKELAIGSNRQIKEIPSSISQLASLTTFQASSNQIQTLPDAFVQLKALTELDLSHNRLVILPHDMDRLTALTDLDISGNVLTRIPPCFGNMRALQQVKASFNPGLSDVPAEYLKAPTTWISCTGNSKIESEYYFARKKPHDKLGRWLPTEEEDLAPADTSISVHHAQLAAFNASTPPNSPPKSSIAPIAEEYEGGTSPSDTHGDKFNLATVVSSPFSKPSDPSAESTALSSTASDTKTDSTSRSLKSSGGKKDKDGKPKDKGSKSKSTNTALATHEFHTPSLLDDRRLTLLADDDSDTTIPTITTSTSQRSTPESTPSPLATSTSSLSSNSSVKKDKKKEKEEHKKREKELLTSLGSDNLVMRTPQVGWAEMRGGRPDMQDSLVIMEHFQRFPELTLIGLFDGHGGTETALLAAKKLPALAHDSMRQVLEHRDLEFTIPSLLSMSHADWAIIIRATFMALHGAIAKAGYTDGTAATIAIVVHQYGNTPRTPSPPQQQSITTTLNVVYGDEVYSDTNVAGWCEKGRAAQMLLTSPPTSATAGTNPNASSAPIAIPGSMPQLPQQDRYAGPASFESDGEPSSPYKNDGRNTYEAAPASSPSALAAKQKKGPRNKSTSHSPASSSTSNSPFALATSGRSLLVLGNCGDQRAVLCRKGQAFPLTKDHKPENPAEMARIALSGGFVAESRRVNGLLALSRAIGDLGVQPHVTFEPDIMVVELTEHDEFIILACDGVWDVLSSEQAVFLALAESSPSRAANRIREYAFSLGSTDNISVIVYQLKARERTNFGTCLMTHIAESLAVQAASPRTVTAISSTFPSTTSSLLAPAPSNMQPPSPRDTPVSSSPSSPVPFEASHTENSLSSSSASVGKKRKKPKSTTDLGSSAEISSTSGKQPRESLDPKDIASKEHKEHKSHKEQVKNS